MDIPDKEMDALHGKWKLDKSRNINVEEFLTAQGYPADLVAKVSAADGYFEATPDSGKTRVVISSTGRPSTSHLVAVDEPFQLSTPEGIVLTCKCTVEGEGRFREHYSSPDQGVEFITIREVKGKVMKSETSAKGRSMTQVYNKNFTNLQLNYLLDTPPPPFSVPCIFHSLATFGYCNVILKLLKFFPFPCLIIVVNLDLRSFVILSL